MRREKRGAFFSIAIRGRVFRRVMPLAGDGSPERKTSQFFGDLLIERRDGIAQ